MEKGVQEVRTNNVVLRLKFSMASPPAYLKGKDRVAYMEERAWVANDFADYAGRQGQYAEKAESHDSKLVAPDKGTYLEYVSRQGTFSAKGEKGESKMDGTGIWGKNGVIEGAELERVKKVFKETKGHIWHGLISPTKELGDKFLGDKESAMEFAKSCFTRFLSSTHLKYDNIEWYCGWHDDSASGIKHIQFAFCEKEPHLNSKGEKGYTKKGLIRKTALADALVSMEEYFSGHRDDVHTARDEISKQFKAMHMHDVKTAFAIDLIELAQELPKVNGRAGYRHPDYEPFRAKIDDITMRMIRDVPELNKSYINLMSKVAEREERFNATVSGLKNMQPSDKIAELREDIRIRLGNSIVSLAKRLRYETSTEMFAALKAQHLSMMAQAKAESALRRQKQAEAKRTAKRLRRIFGEWWQETTSPNYLEQFYKDIARIKAENEDTSEHDD